MTRARVCLGSRLPEIPYGFLPELPSERMVSERFDLFAEPIDVQIFDSLQDAPVEHPSAVLQQTPVGHLWVSACLKVYWRSGNSWAS